MALVQIVGPVLHLTDFETGMDRGGNVSRRHRNAHVEETPVQNCFRSSTSLNSEAIEQNVLPFLSHLITLIQYTVYICGGSNLGPATNCFSPSENIARHDRSFRVLSNSLLNHSTNRR
jgi:hypothetical protein